MSAIREFTRVYHDKDGKADRPASFDARQIASVGDCGSEGVYIMPNSGHPGWFVLEPYADVLRWWTANNGGVVDENRGMPDAFDALWQAYKDGDIDEVTLREQIQISIQLWRDGAG